MSLLVDGVPVESITDGCQKCGNPWHGIVASGNITTTVGSVVRSWPNTPDSGDAFIYKAGVLPTTTTSEETAAGMRWDDYAILGGWKNRQLYGQKLEGGNLSWIFIGTDGITYAVDGTGLYLFATGSVSELRGVITIRPLIFNISNGAITLDITPLALDGLRSHLDILAISQNGREVIIGAWNSAYSYNAAIGDRGVARLTGSESRYAAGTHIKLSATELSASAVVHKTSEEIYSSVTENTPFTSTALYVRSVETQEITFDEDDCSTITYEFTRSFVTDCSTDGHDPPAITISCIGFSYIPNGTAESTQTNTTIIGYIHNGSAFKPITLEYRSTSSSSQSGSLVGDGSRTRVYSGPTCTVPIATDTGALPTAGVEVEYSTTSTQSAVISVDGTDISKIQHTHSYSGSYFDPVAGAPTDYVVISDTRSTSFDGVDISHPSIEGMTGQGSASNGSIKLSIPVTAASGYTAPTIHCIRYTNNAYGLMLSYAADYGYFTGGYAYFGGVVNVVTESRQTALGWQTTPNTTTTFAYSRNITIEPNTGAYYEGSSPCCYV